MDNTDTSKSWITTKTITIAARIPHDIHNHIEEYGKQHYPRGENGYDKTATIIDLILKGLGLESVEQPVIHSVNQVDVEQAVKQIVKQEITNEIEQIVLSILMNHIPVKHDVVQIVKQETEETVEQSVIHSVNHSNIEPLIDTPTTQDLWIVCQLFEGKCHKFWTGKDWDNLIVNAKTYTKESSVKSVVCKLKRAGNGEIRYNTLERVNKLLNT